MLVKSWDGRGNKATWYLCIYMYDNLVGACCNVCSCFYFQESIQGDFNTVWSKASLFDAVFIVLYIVSVDGSKQSTPHSQAPWSFQPVLAFQNATRKAGNSAWERGYLYIIILCSRKFCQEKIFTNFATCSYWPFICEFFSPILKIA